MEPRVRKTIAYLAMSAGDWGGASRVLFCNIRLLDLNRYEPIVLLPHKGPIVPQLNELGVRYTIWGPRREFKGLLQYARDVIRTVQFFRQNRVDLLHVNQPDYWRPAEILAARLLRIPVITHYHSIVKAPGPYVRLSSLIATVSDYTAQQSKPKTVPMEVIHNSVSLDRFDQAVDIREDLGLSPDDVVISFVGQVREIKGVDLFIRMAHRIPGGSVKFLIVGECRDPHRFPGTYSEQRLLEEIGDDPRIKYIGYRSDVENVYRSSDLIVMPSRWGEPFGLINIEAGAAGKPMIATRDGGIPEIIRHGENGFLVEREDLDELTRLTRLLVEDGELRKRMGRRAREIVETHFTVQPVRKLEALYDRLIRH